MSTATHVKLGVLALAAGLAGVATALGLGIHAVRASSEQYHTYFDESVQGLELGSPVKYRGVRIGRVAEISIAPDRKHVDVVLALGAAPANRLGLAETQPELRAQLGTQGVTGVKYVDIDFFDPKKSPPPTLPFATAERYIPARASLMKSLEDNLDAIGPKLPPLVDHLDAAVAKLTRVLDEVSDEQVARRFAKAADEAGLAAAEVRRLGRQLSGARLGDKSSAALERATAAAARLEELAGRFDGVGALVTSARRASDSIGELGRSTLGSNEELDRTLRELGDAARSVRELADTIQRDPGVLVNGRGRSKKP